MRNLPSRLVLLALINCGPSLHSAALNGDLATVKERLAKGANPNEGDDDRSVPVCSAVSNGHEEVVVALLDAKADPNVSCWPSDTAPTRSAFSLGQPVALAALLAHGADPYPKPYKNLLLTETYHPNEKVIAVYLDHVERTAGRAKVLELIQQRSEHDSWTPISKAAHDGSAEILRVFMEHGADPNARYHLPLDGSPDEWPLIFFARYSGKPEAADVLFKAGAKASATSKLGHSYEKATTPVRTAMAEFQEREQQFNAQWEAAKRAEAVEDRRQEAEAQRNAAAHNQAMWNRVSGQTPSNNPLDDNSFQERMRAQAQQEQQRKQDQQRKQVEQARPQPTSSELTPKSAAPTAAVAASAGPPEAKRDNDKKSETDARNEAVDRKRAADEKAVREKADREAKEAAAKEAAAQKRAAYLDTMRRGIRLKAGTCPGDKDFHVIGTRPNQDACINVTYRATCSTNQGAGTGTMRAFAGGGSCFGDSQVISPKPNCKVEEVSVIVDSVQYCSP